VNNKHQLFLMKKFSIMAAVAICTLGFTSCKKEYTCTCSTTLTGNNTTSTTTINLGKQKKKDADGACEARVTNVMGGTMTCAVD